MAMTKGADGLYTMDSMSQVLKNNGKANTKQINNINDFISRVKESGQDTTQLYNELSQVKSVDELRAIEKKYLGENSINKNIDISKQGDDAAMFKSLQQWQQNLAGQQEASGGKQIANTNAAVAAAKPGDWFIRSNGQMVVLNEDHIKWAQKKFPDKYPTAGAVEQTNKQTAEDMPTAEPNTVDTEKENSAPTSEPDKPKEVKTGHPVEPKQDVSAKIAEIDAQIAELTKQKEALLGGNNEQRS